VETDPEKIAEFGDEEYASEDSSTSSP